MYNRATAKLNQHAGAIILALAVLGTGAYAYQLNEQSDQEACQSKVNLAVSKNIRIRSDIAQRDREATTTLLTGVGGLFLLPPTTDKKEQAKREKEFLDLFRNFNSTMSDVARARAANPIPEIDGICE